MISVTGYIVRMATDLMKLTRLAVDKSGLSLYEIARRAGISYSRLHDLVRGRTKAARSGTIIKIITACGADLKLVWSPRSAKKGR